MDINQYWNALIKSGVPKEDAAKNRAYTEGYDGNTSSLYATPSNVGIGKSLHTLYLKGQSDKAAGKFDPPVSLATPTSPNMAVPVALPSGGRKRKTKKAGKTKKGGRRHKKAYTRRR